ncbi:PAP2 superfamily protein [Hirsutella rhossiliensis]|uniref:PAP2 superfamily domain-containing protein n=1 Tax=Hirsutella rhossiliensis TaxID=111463 RepID=A0A9P8SDG6_9HYPO|nr:PAP2 superfamily domain-containing protein [Hirsutella rhossiliensis]KAH0957320.1 PAP2 superfamily domain-containing protein [Hirsutella rhossiliensis]
MASPPSGRSSLALAASYAFDWIILVVVVVAGGILGRIEPNKRPFSLDDPNISFPFTVNQTVPTWLLVILCGLAPAVIILFIAIVLVPGGTVPKNTPQVLIWKRKLWEWHVGWLGLLLAVGSAFFFISGIKNMCGKPRPDLLSRCEPDIANRDSYQVGGFKGEAAGALLYSGSICKQTDKYKLDDGFRSYPSGHAAASAAGLIYLSLYLASKFAVTIPFVVPNANTHGEASSHVAFPSRANAGADSSYEASSIRNGYTYGESPTGKAGSVANRNAKHNMKVQSLRRQAAAPPIYLLVITLAPFCLSIFISASRWFDFRHHGFDILFGYLIGTICAIYSFRYYHMPIRAGAGWAWGPRSGSRAFWAGVGRLGYAGERSDFDARVDQADLGESGDVDLHPAHQAGDPSMGGGGGMSYRAAHYGASPQQPGPFQDVELERMENMHRPMGPPGHASSSRDVR